MIPHHLSLTNFLSYRDTAELDLRGVHLACISGLNGAGKSSILDAITWALFGKSRAGSDDNVVNRIAAGNGKAAEVSFVFELEGAVYRIIRRKPFGKTMQLELHVRGEEDGQVRWRTLTDARIRDTQHAIEELLSMSYDVFTNASFLLQGKADEFTTKTADKRKEILAGILGVNRWDEYKTRATDRRKAAETEAKILDRQLADIEAELAQEAERQRELELAVAREAAVAAQLAAQDALVTQLREKRTLIEQQQTLLARTAAELARTRAELERIEREAAQRRGELETYRDLLARAEAIEAAHAASQAAEAALVRWQEKAEQHNALQGERHPLEMAMAQARTRLEQKLQTLEKQAEQATAAAAARETIAAQLASQRTQLAQVAARAAELAEQETAWHSARDRFQRLDADRRLWKQERDQLAARAAAVANARAERAMVAVSRDSTQARLDDAQTALDGLNEQQNRLAEVKVERAALEAERAGLEKEGSEHKATIEQLESETGGQCPVCSQPLTEEHRQTTLHEWQTKRDALRARFTAVRAQVQSLADEEKSLSATAPRRAQLERERDTQQRALSRYEAQLGHIDASIADWESGEAQARLDELEAWLAGEDGLLTLQAEIDTLKTAADQARQVTREQQVLTGEISRLETRCEELDRVAQSWTGAGRPEMETTRRALTEQSYASEARQALVALDARLAAVAYDAAAHATARQQRAQWANAPEEYQQLRRAEAAMKPLADALDNLRGQSERAVARVADWQTQHEQLTAALRDLQAGAADLRSAEAELTRLRDDHAAAIRISSAARQKVEVLGDQRRASDRLRAEKQALAAHIGLLRELEDACGRNGVQALLIETVLPEIEEHANDLLHRLSGGEMHVRFDPQRERKSDGNQIETLDIKIADNSGERPYENYSGGEKFRVNFAIRLALSQVLAKRAGARLRTLVIDEGFGSQDPEGRQRLVEAINEVQADFACILVITHIDELRDKFPARIEVEKTAGGSRLSLVAV